MEHGWTCTLPYCLDELDFNRNMNTQALATAFRSRAPDLTDDHGILYGINRRQRLTHHLDRLICQMRMPTCLPHPGR